MRAALWLRRETCVRASHSKAITWPAQPMSSANRPSLSLSTASVFFAFREINVGADHTPRNAVAIIVNAAARLDPSRLGVAAEGCDTQVVLAAIPRLWRPADARQSRGKSSGCTRAAIRRVRSQCSLRTNHEWWHSPPTLAFPRLQVVGKEVPTRATTFPARASWVLRSASVFSASFTLTDIDKHVDAADQCARRIEERCRKRNERNTRAVGAFRNSLCTADGFLVSQGHRHRTLVVRQRPTVRGDKASRSHSTYWCRARG